MLELGSLMTIVGIIISALGAADLNILAVVGGMSLAIAGLIIRERE